MAESPGPQPLVPRPRGPEPLDEVIAATTHWLASAFPATGGRHAATLARQQARQAVTLAAWLRFPTAMDAALLAVLPPSGTWWLDDIAPDDAEALPWRTWVDDVVASWAGALLADRDLALRACAAAAGCEHAAGLPFAFTRLTDPDALDLAAAALLRHPDLLFALAAPHRADLERLIDEAAPAA